MDLQIGTPGDGGFSYEEIYQGNNGTCAIHAQFHVLKEYGYEGSVNDLIVESMENKWSDYHGGTPIKNIGCLLESHGVPCSQIHGNLDTLITELACGKQVIVAVDSKELWENQDDGDNADHALTVCGMRVSDTGNVTVTVTDSGTGHLAKEYPLEKFLDAWQDSSCLMVTPDNPPPPEMELERLANFDYEVGHIEQLGDMTFDEVAAKAALYESSLTDEDRYQDDGEILSNDIEDDFFEDVEDELENNPFEGISGVLSNEVPAEYSETSSTDESEADIFEDISFITGQHVNELLPATVEIDSFESNEDIFEDISFITGQHVNELLPATVEIDSFESNEDIFEDISFITEQHDDETLAITDEISVSESTYDAFNDIEGIANDIDADTFSNTEFIDSENGFAESDGDV